MSQARDLYNLLSDGQPHRTDHIVDQVYGPGLSLARVGARINDLANGRWEKGTHCEFVDEFGNPLGREKNQRKGWKDKDNPKLYWYRMYVPRVILPPAYPPKKVETKQMSLI